MLPWKKLDEKLVYDGWRKVLRKTFELPTGQVVEYETMGPKREIVCILPLTPDNRIVLTPQFRTGPEKVFFELPGGMVDKGETKEVAASRELVEETGYQGILTFVVTTAHDGFADAVRHHFVAKNCIEVATPIADPDNVQHESMIISLDEFKKLVRNGELTDIATAYLGLDFLHLL